MTAGPTARRALLITKTDPGSPRDGGTLRVAAVVSGLREDGWTVDVVPVRTATGRRRVGLPPVRGARAGRAASAVLAATAQVGSLSVARWADIRVAAEIARLRSTHAYDLAVIEFSQLLIYRRLLDGVPQLLDLHNLEAELLANYATSARSLLRRTAARWETARVAGLESAASLRRLDTVVAVSEREAQHVSQLLGSETVETVPNGVADAAFQVEKALASPPVVVFVAHLGWQPNVDGAAWLVERVWPLVRAARPDAVLRLVGRSPAAAVVAAGARDGVEVHADVPSTLPHLAAASVATAPLLASGGTRLKILEAMATGTPVVATPLGAMGLEHLAGTGLDVEETAESFARALVDRIVTPGDSGAIRDGVEDYRWRTVLRPLVGAARRIAAREDRR